MQNTKMLEVIFDLLGNFIRWVFVFQCNSKKMNEKYNCNPKSEGLKNTLAGILLLILILLIISFFSL
jgi:hypothetical protein